MFKNIIKGKKTNFTNQNILSLSNNLKTQSLKLFNISEYSFARKQINKQELVNEMSNIMANKRQNESNFQKREEFNTEIKKPLQDFNKILQNNQPEISEEIKQLDNGKFYFDVISDLKAKDFPIEFLQNSLQLIDQKYPNINSEKSTSFRFLVLMHQILNQKDLEFYRNNYGDIFINNAFGHLIEIFENNFILMNKNSDNLLRNNILYFLIINKGEFSDILLKLSNSNKNLKENLTNILNLKLKEINNPTDKISNLNLTNFTEHENNNNNAPSEIINDYSFKYRTIEAKRNLYNKLITQKQNVNKMRFLIDSKNKFIENEKDKVNLDELMKTISLFLLKDSKEILNEDLIKINTELQNNEKFIEEIVLSLTNLKILPYNKITSENLENIFNPLFSGENNLSVQFTKIAGKFGVKNADNLLKLFCQDLHSRKIITLRNVFNMNFSLTNFSAFSPKEIFFNFIFFEEKEFNYAKIIEKVNFTETIEKNEVHFDNSERKFFDEIRLNLYKIGKIDNFVKNLKEEKLNVKNKVKNEDLPKVEKKEKIQKIQKTEKIEKRLTIEEILNKKKNELNDEDSNKKNDLKLEKIVPLNKEKKVEIFSEGSKVKENSSVREKKNKVKLEKFNEEVRRKIVQNESNIKQSEVKAEKIESIIKAEPEKTIEKNESNKAEPVKIVEKKETKKAEPEKTVEKKETKKIEPEKTVEKKESNEAKVEKIVEKKEESQQKKEDIIEKTEPKVEKITKEETKKIEPEKIVEKKESNEEAKVEKTVEKKESNEAKVEKVVEKKEESQQKKEDIIEKTEPKVEKITKEEPTPKKPEEKIEIKESTPKIKEEKITKAESEPKQETQEAQPQKEIIQEPNQTIESTNLTMEEKFRKQKQKKNFYFNDKKEFSTLIKTNKKNFSTFDKNEDFENQMKELEKENNNQIKEINKPKIRIQKFQEISYGQKENSEKPEKPISSLSEEKTKNYEKPRNYLENITKNNNQKTTYKKKDKNFSFISYKSKLNLPDKIKIDPLEEEEKEFSILNLLEEEDRIKNRTLNEENNEIIIETNNEISEFGNYYWLKLSSDLKSEVNPKEKCELHFIHFLK